MLVNMRAIELFAHEGHDHPEVTTIPWWQDPLSVSAVVIAGFAVLLFVSHYVFKAKFGLKIVLAMGYLLAVGLFCYRVAPVLSIAALGLGLGIALITTLLQLGHKKQPPQK